MRKERRWCRYQLETFLIVCGVLMVAYRSYNSPEAGYYKNEKLTKALCKKFGVVLCREEEQA